MRLSNLRLTVAGGVLLTMVVIGGYNVVWGVDCGEGCSSGCEDWDEWGVVGSSFFYKYSETVTMKGTCSEVPDGGRYTHSREVNRDKHEDFEADCPNAETGVFQTGAVKGNKVGDTETETIKVECEEE